MEPLQEDTDLKPFPKVEIKSELDYSSEEESIIIKEETFNITNGSLLDTEDMEIKREDIIDPPISIPRPPPLQCLEKEDTNSRDLQTEKSSKQDTYNYTIVIVDDIEKYKCGICSVYMSRKNNLLQHFKLTHNTNRQMHKCPKCQFQTHNKGYLGTHIKTIHSEEVYHCPLCSFKCKAKVYLKTHVNNMHHKACMNKSEVYKCTKCPYQTQIKMYIKRHHKVKHGEATLGCTLCSYKCHNKRSLQVHIYNKHNKQPQIYECGVCSYQFKHKYSLKHHFKYTHEKNAEVFKCERCDYQAKRKDGLIRHFVNVHSESDEVLRCSECSFRTTNKYNLKKHCNRRHEEGRIFECAGCSFRTKYKRNLRLHLKIKHGFKSSLASNE